MRVRPGGSETLMNKGKLSKSSLYGESPHQRASVATAVRRTHHFLYADAWSGNLALRARVKSGFWTLKNHPEGWLEYHKNLGLRYRPTFSIILGISASNSASLTPRSMESSAKVNPFGNITFAPSSPMV
jgi:hypothetical protein